MVIGRTLSPALSIILAMTLERWTFPACYGGKCNEEEPDDDLTSSRNREFVRRDIVERMADFDKICRTSITRRA